MFIDTHTHLDQQDFDADRTETIARARRAGLETMLCVAGSAASSHAVLRLGREFGLPVAVGIHPNSAAEAAATDWDDVVTMASQSEVVAIGETGLDRYWDHTPIGLQQDYLERHLRLAAERALPVILHCREAQDDMLPTLRAAAAHGSLRGVMHAFSGTDEFAAECLALGLHLSFAGNVTYSNKKFERLREVARQVPENRLLVETDSPYLVPQIFRGKQQRNEPANVIHTAAFLADLRGVPIERLAAATTANARALFHLPAATI